jgi:homoserine kinase
MAAGALFACWSGAGPSVLALSSAGERTAIAGRFASILNGSGLVLTPEIARRGIE